MYKLKVAVFLAILVAFLVPMAVSAAGTFYCSALYSGPDGNGSYRYPWPCANQEQLNRVIYEYICNGHGGGHLYQILAGGYVYYRIEWIYQQNQRTCVVTYKSEHPGYPPHTGVDLPTPMIIGLAIGAAMLLLVVGLVLRRKSVAA